MANLDSNMYNEMIKELEEPITETIKRDLNMIVGKLKVVVFPFLSPDEDRRKTLRNWDLWGPLLICILLSLVLTFNSIGESQTKFSLIFGVTWVGGFIVTVNAQLLKAHVNTFQLMCTLGYSSFPLLFSAVLKMFLGTNLYLVQLLVQGVMASWCVQSSWNFIQELVEEDRNLLALYPVVIFYVFLSWMVSLD